jgi:hypothetical protein
MHLVLALLWLVLGGAVLAWQGTHPDDPGWRILGSNVSVGWLALLFALYDGLRWWSQRSLPQTRRSPRQARSRQAPGPSLSADPQLDFNAPSSPPESDSGPSSRQ